MAEGTLPPAPDSEPTPFLHPDEPPAAGAAAGFHEPARPAAPPPKRRRRRIWPKVLLVLLILVVLAVVFAPALLSTAPARSFVVGKINQSLNGRVEINNWALGWTSPVTVSVRCPARDGACASDPSWASAALNAADRSAGFSVGAP